MKFLIKYATRGRREKFLKCMENIQKTISKTANYTIIVSIDEDDETMKDLPYFPYTYVCVGKSKNKVQAINSNMDIINDWDILINFSDDMVFVERDWDVIILFLCKSFWKDTDFFAHFNDGYVGNKLPTMSIMGRKYFERDGYIYHPSYKTESCDAEAMFVAMMRGKHRYFEPIIYKHEHPCNNGEQTDATYERNGVYAKSDHQNYYNRMKNYFDVPEQERTCVPFKNELETT